MVEWQLEGCCGTEEITFLCFYAGYVVAFFLLYSSFILKPMRLLAVFVHEWGHASACWITGGEVRSLADGFVCDGDFLAADRADAKFAYIRGWRGLQTFLQSICISCVHR